MLLEARVWEASKETQQVLITYEARTTWEAECEERGRRYGVLLK